MRSTTQRPRNVVQIHWQNSPSSLSDPSEQFQFAHDIGDLVPELCEEDVIVRLCDPTKPSDRVLRDDCAATVIVLAVADTKLDKDNAAIVNKLLKHRRAVFLVLQGLTDGNIVRFGFSPDHSNDVFVYDLSSFPKGEMPGRSQFDLLVHQVNARLNSVFNDYPVDNFAILLQQRRDAEVKQERRSWILLLLALMVMLVLAVAFMLVARITLDTKHAELDVLANATADANVNAQRVSEDLATLEEQYVSLHHHWLHVCGRPCDWCAYHGCFVCVVRTCCCCDREMRRTLKLALRNAGVHVLCVCVRSVT